MIFCYHNHQLRVRY